MNERTIFLTALEMTASAERAAYLEEACGGDASLRHRVEALIAAHENAGDFLEQPPSVMIARDATTVTAGEDANDVTAILDPCDDPDRLGKLGPYEVIEIVGSGGMGIVLRALDPKLNRIVAIKVMKPALATSSIAVQRFLREAQAAAAVSHLHVVTIHAVDETKRLPFLVMEFIEGQSLEQKIDREAALPLRQILRIGMQAADGLAAAHRQGLVHRDIKPANILLENGIERVKITDFGLARAVDDVAITQTGQIAGTPSYMSPEQAQGRAIDHRTDLFSLGSVLYTMCTGRAPYRAETAVATLRQVCDEVPTPIAELNSDIPRWLIEVVARLMAKQPGDRYQSADEVREIFAVGLAKLQQSPADAGSPAGSPFATASARQIETSEMSRRDSRLTRRMNGRRRWSIGVVTAMSVVAATAFTEATGVTAITATVIRIVLGEGMLVVEVDDPGVSVAIDGKELTITGAWPKEIRLTAGSYDLEASRDGKPVLQEKVTIERDGRTIVRVGATAAAGADNAEEAEDKAFRQEFDLVVRAGRGKLSARERRELRAQNSPLLAQLADPNTKKVIELFANLPQASLDELLADGYLKWKFSELDPARRKVYEDALKLNLEFAKKQGVDPPGSMSLEALAKGEVGFAIVNIPELQAKVVSWYMLLPDHPAPIWVTIVGTQAAGKPPYFAAHNMQLNALREEPDSTLPAKAESNGRAGKSDNP